MWCDSTESVEPYSWNYTQITIRYDVLSLNICVYTSPDYLLIIQLCSAEEQKLKYVKLSLKAVVEDEGEHKGRRVTTSCRGLPMHDLHQPWLQQLNE